MKKARSLNKIFGLFYDLKLAVPFLTQVASLDTTQCLERWANKSGKEFTTNSCNNSKTQCIYMLCISKLLNSS